MDKSLGIGFVIGATVSSTVASAFSTVESRLKSARQQMNEASKEARTLQAALELRTRRDEIRAGYLASGGTDTTLRQELLKVNGAYLKARSAALVYGRSIEEWSRRQEEAAKRVELTHQRVRAFGSLQEQAARRQELRGQMVGTAVGAMSLAAPVQMAASFESAMADAAKNIEGMRDATGSLTPAYHEMEAAVKRMGRTLPLAHSEIAGLFAAAGQQGVSGVAELEAFSTLAAHMSVAFGMSTEEAADAIGGYCSALKLSLPEARSLLDLMNQYASTSSASERGIADVVRRIGPLGNVGGVAAKPIAALAATLDSMKVAPEVAATGIKNLILAMTSGAAATKGQSTAFARLGIDTVNLAKQMQIDGPAAIVSVLEAIQRLPKDEQLSIMQEIFGKESLDSISPLLDSLDLVKKNLRIAGDESSYAGAMQQEFENRSRTTANAFVLFKNRIAELGITIGSVLLPPLVAIMDAIGPWVSAVADFAQRHQTLTTVLMGAAAGFIGMKIVTMGTLYVWSSLRSSGIALALVWSRLPAPFRAHAAAVLTGAGASLKAAAAYAWKRAAALAAAAATRTMTAAQWVYTTATQGSIRAVLRSTVALAWQRSTAIATTVALRAMAAGQWLLNAAMSANPLGLVIAGVAGLAAGLVWLYRNCAPVRIALDALWSGIRVIGKYALSVLVFPFVMAFNICKSVLGAIAGWVGAVWNRLRGAAGNAWSAIASDAGTSWSTIVETVKTAWAGIASRGIAAVVTRFSSTALRWDASEIPFPVALMWQWAVQTFFAGMAVQTGSLGDVVFEVSQGRIYTPEGVNPGRSARYEDHEVQGAEPRPEFLSPGLGEISLNMTLRRDLGVDPVAEADKLKTYMDKGEVLRLVLAGTNLGKWTIRKMDQGWRHMVKGVTGPLSMTLTVELTEYF